MSKISFSKILIYCFLISIITCTFASSAEALPESDHDYANNFDYTWPAISIPGATQMRLHFTKLDFGGVGGDYLRLIDKDGKELATYSSTEEDFWTEWFTGDTLKVRFQTNDRTTGYGFKIDKVETRPEKPNTPEVTPTPEASNYQDAQWLATSKSDGSVVLNNVKDASRAKSNHDFTSLSTYAGIMHRDCQKAIDNSDLYNVSPDLQGTKDEYRLALVQNKLYAMYTRMAADEYNKGNKEGGDSYSKQATQCETSFIQHITKATNLLTAYNSGKN